MDTTTGFGQWLKERRKSLDMTQAALGRLTGCSESSIRKIEAGTLKPSRQVADLLAEGLRIPEKDRTEFIRWARSTQGGQPHSRMGEQPARNGASAKLPIPPTTLIGRETDVAEVLDMIGREGLRLLTLTGPPGTGKTRLAMQVSSEAIDRFAEGVVFVALAHISDPDLVISTIARTLGVSEAKGQSPVEALTEHLSERDILLVLDNFEQIIAAASEIADLLVGAEKCKILVTSREALHIRGEQIYPVPPLAVPSAAGKVEEIAEVPAVALFVQRAQETDPAFRLTQANAEDVAAICRKLEGLPLAIELAAARIAIFSPGALLTRMDRRLSLLTDGARDLPPRQRTLRNAVASSYDLLDEAEQELFRQLAVFAGGWTLGAAEQFANYESIQKENIPHLLGSLQAKSLIRRDGQEAEPRFVMLEMIREYALEKLQEAGKEEQTQRNHALHFMRVAEEAEPLIMGGKQMGLLEMLERDHANLRAALTWAHNAGEDGVDLAARMCSALSRFWLRRGHWTEGRRWIEDTLALLESHQNRVTDPAQKKGREEKHARLLHMAGVMAYRQGEYNKANTQIESSIKLWRELGDQPGSLAEVLQDAGTLAVLRDEYGKATQALTEALEIHKTSKNRQGSAQVLTMLGFEAMALGDFERSSRQLNEALALFTEMGDRWGVVRVKQHIAVVARNLGDFALAQRLLEENLAASTELNNKSAIAASMGEMGMLALAQGDHERAGTLTTEVLDIYTALGGKSAGAVAILTLGLVALYRGDYEAAESHCIEALQIFHHEEARYDTASSLMALAGVASARGYAKRSARLLGASESIFSSLGAHKDYFSRILQSQLTARLRAHLGESTFSVTRQEGAVMPLDRAVQYALDRTQDQEQQLRGAHVATGARYLSKA